MRILLVEDDIQLGKATAEGLKTTFAVDWCQSAEDAEVALATTSYDLVVLDINLPEKSGLELLKELRGSNNKCPVLFLTAYDGLENRIDGLNAGADDYLVKPFDLHELIARIGAVVRRSQGRANPVITLGEIVFDPAAKQVTQNGAVINLSARELAVFEILMNNIAKIVSKEQIEEHVYDWSSGDIESNTIEVHISALRRKLGRDVIKTMRGIGYILQ